MGDYKYSFTGYEEIWCIIEGLKCLRFCSQLHCFHHWIFYPRPKPSLSHKSCSLSSTLITMQEENKFAILLIANWLNLIFAYYIFKNFSMIAYIIEIKNQNWLIFNTLKLINLSKVVKLSSVYVNFHPVGYS